MYLGSVDWSSFPLMVASAVQNKHLTSSLCVRVVAWLVQKPHRPCSNKSFSSCLTAVQIYVKLIQIIWYGIGLRVEVFREGMLWFNFYRITNQVISTDFEVTWVSFSQEQLNIFSLPITPKSRLSSLLFTTDFFRCSLKWQFHFSKFLAEYNFNFLSGFFFSLGIKISIKEQRFSVRIAY